MFDLEARSAFLHAKLIASQNCSCIHQSNRYEPLAKVWWLAHWLKHVHLANEELAQFLLYQEFFNTLIGLNSIQKQIHWKFVIFFCETQHTISPGINPMLYMTKHFLCNQGNFCNVFSNILFVCFLNNLISTSCMNCLASKFQQEGSCSSWYVPPQNLHGQMDWLFWSYFG